MFGAGAVEEGHVEGTETGRGHGVEERLYMGDAAAYAERGEELKCFGRVRAIISDAEG